jgi:hypothetical protein
MEDPYTDEELAPYDAEGAMIDLELNIAIKMHSDILREMKAYVKSDSLARVSGIVDALQMILREEYLCMERLS